MVKWLKGLFARRTHTLDIGDDGLLAAREAWLDLQRKTPTPWAMFEINGIEEDGKMPVDFDWNPAFIKKMDSLGFTAETEADTVQLFFYASQMKPTEVSEVSGDESVQISDLPGLSENVNKVVR